VFQAEVSRMMKLIINSLYRNKEVCRIEFYWVSHTLVSGFPNRLLPNW
jgi:hypothetical protein